MSARVDRWVWREALSRVERLVPADAPVTDLRRLSGFLHQMADTALKLGDGEALALFRLAAEQATERAHDPGRKLHPPEVVATRAATGAALEAAQDAAERMEAAMRRAARAETALRAAKAQAAAAWAEADQLWVERAWAP